MTERAIALTDILASRRSCRGFLPDEVPGDTVQRLLSMAQRSASWCNTQPWHLYVTRGDGTERLRESLTTAEASSPDFEFPRKYTGKYQDRRRECAIQLYESMGVARGDRVASSIQTERNFDLFGAPHLAIVTSDRDLGIYGAVDCGLYVQSFLLSAEALGLGAIAQAAIAHKSAAVRAALDLPDDRTIVCGISFGYADPDHPSSRFSTTRAAVDDAVTFVH